MTRIQAHSPGLTLEFGAGIVGLSPKTEKQLRPAQNTHGQSAIVEPTYDLGLALTDVRISRNGAKGHIEPGASVTITGTITELGRED